MTDEQRKKKFAKEQSGVRRGVKNELGEWARLALKSQGHTPAAHHQLVIRELEGLIGGEFDRLMVLMPPGSAKSTYTFQDNWTGTDILVPPTSVVEWTGAWGGWHAVSFPLGDYLAPAGDGSLIVRSAVGDVVARPAGSGRVRVSSDAEPLGFASLLGRGSPEGVKAAPPGSDYRNLDGGAGATLWVKRVGTTAIGWVAVA